MKWLKRNNPIPPIREQQLPNKIIKKLLKPAEKDFLYKPIATEEESMPATISAKRKKSIKKATMAPIIAAPIIAQTKIISKLKRNKLNSSSSAGVVLPCAYIEIANIVKKKIKISFEKDFIFAKITVLIQNVQSSIL